VIDQSQFKYKQQDVSNLGYHSYLCEWEIKLLLEELLMESPEWQKLSMEMTEKQLSADLQAKG
jgi:hypothetical protein